MQLVTSNRERPVQLALEISWLCSSMHMPSLQPQKHQPVKQGQLLNILLVYLIYTVDTNNIQNLHWYSMIFRILSKSSPQPLFFPSQPLLLRSIVMSLMPRKHSQHAQIIRSFQRPSRHKSDPYQIVISKDTSDERTETLSRCLDDIDETHDCCSFVR